MILIFEAMYNPEGGTLVQKTEKKSIVEIFQYINLHIQLKIFFKYKNALISII